MLPEIILFPEIYLELEKMCCFRKSINLCKESIFPEKFYWLIC